MRGTGSKRRRRGVPVKAIEHAEAEHRLGRILEVGCALGGHVQKLRILSLKMRDDFRYADHGPACVELAGRHFAGLLGNGNKLIRAILLPNRRFL